MRRCLTFILALAVALPACSGSSDSCPEGEDYVVILPLSTGSTTRVDFEISWTSRTDVVGEPVVATVEGPFRNDEPSYPPLAADVTVLTLTESGWVPGALPVADDAITLPRFDELDRFYRFEIEPLEDGDARIQIRPGFATTPPDCETRFGDMTADVVQLSVTQDGVDLVEISRDETPFWWEVEFAPP